jgi:DNA-directed RNA polymerase specialized sigma24 family protein
VRRGRLTSKQWTPLDDERLRSLAIAGMDAKEIATELERTVAAVRSRTERFRVSLRRVSVARRSPWSSSG